MTVPHAPLLLEAIVHSSPKTGPSTPCHCLVLTQLVQQVTDLHVLFAKLVHTVFLEGLELKVEDRITLEC